MVVRVLAVLDLEDGRADEFDLARLDECDQFEYCLSLPPDPQFL